MQPQERTISINPGIMSGTVESIEVKNKKLILTGKNIDIAFKLESEKSLSILKNTESFNYSNHKRPDGPVATLALNDPDLLAWIGDGIRNGMGPEGLSIEPGTAVDSLVLKSGETIWTVPAEKETIIQWKGASWLVYASGITKGTLADQPAFAADIIILRQ
ncbi:hypothetical protein [Oceanispirochaeta sp.]|uniref:hypothetical protein n=1 Tax=Oceanispirochaeta sp. TaxID=2035350 RepID=UPI00262082D6|nr:hypothetical protein [Oceanispirochaeta sp.]MDA3956002.1 hypothetical protein [Oceanispirochaeta sp.]